MHCVALALWTQTSSRGVLPAHTGKLGEQVRERSAEAAHLAEQLRTAAQALRAAEAPGQGRAAVHEAELRLRREHADADCAQEAELDLLRGDLQESAAELAQMEERLQERDASLEQLRAQLLERSSAVEDLQQDLQQRTVELAQLQERLQDSNASLEHSREDVQERTHALDELRGSLSEREAALERLRGDLRWRDAAVERLQGGLQDRMHELSQLRGALQEREAALEQLGWDQCEREAALEQLQGAREAAGAAHAAELAAAHERQASLEGQVTSPWEQADSAHDAAAHMQAELAAAMEEAATLRGALAAREQLPGFAEAHAASPANVRAAYAAGAAQWAQPRTGSALQLGGGAAEPLDEAAASDQATDKENRSPPDAPPRGKAGVIAAHQARTRLKSLTTRDNFRGPWGGSAARSAGLAAVADGAAHAAKRAGEPEGGGEAAALANSANIAQGLTQRDSGALHAELAAAVECCHELQACPKRSSPPHTLAS